MSCDFCVKIENIFSMAFLKTCRATPYALRNMPAKYHENLCTCFRDFLSRVLSVKLKIILTSIEFS